MKIICKWWRKFVLSKSDIDLLWLEFPVVIHENIFALPLTMFIILKIFLIFYVMLFTSFVTLTKIPHSHSEFNPHWCSICLAAAYARGDPVLVYSDRGISRSAGVVVAFVSFHMRLNSKVCFHDLILFDTIIGFVFSSDWIGSIGICWTSSFSSSATLVYSIYWSIEWKIEWFERSDGSCWTNVDHCWWSIDNRFLRLPWIDLFFFSMRNKFLLFSKKWSHLIIASFLSKLRWLSSSIMIQR